MGNETKPQTQQESPAVALGRLRWAGRTEQEKSAHGTMMALKRWGKRRGQKRARKSKA